MITASNPFESTPKFHAAQLSNPVVPTPQGNNKSPPWIPQTCRLENLKLYTLSFEIHPNLTSGYECKGVRIGLILLFLTAGNRAFRPQPDRTVLCVLSIHTDGDQLIPSLEFSFGQLLPLGP